MPKTTQTMTKLDLQQSWAKQGYGHGNIPNRVRKQDIQAVVLQDPACPNCGLNHDPLKREGQYWFIYQVFVNQDTGRYKGLAACRRCEYFDEV